MERVSYRRDAARPVFLRLAFCKGLTSAFSSTTREKPRREGKSAGPSIDPECFINFGVGLFGFAMDLNPLLLRLYHRP
jgi:hypothetical protein